MKVTLESTTRIVRLMVGGRECPARVWEGTTEGGIACFAFITRIAPSVPDPSTEVCREFETDLAKCRAPTVELGPIDMRFIL